MNLKMLLNLGLILFVSVFGCASNTNKNEAAPSKGRRGQGTPQ